MIAVPAVPARPAVPPLLSLPPVPVPPVVGAATPATPLVPTPEGSTLAFLPEQANARASAEKTSARRTVMKVETGTRDARDYTIDVCAGTADRAHGACSRYARRPMLRRGARHVVLPIALAPLLTGCSADSVAPPDPTIETPGTFVAATDSGGVIV